MTDKALTERIWNLLPDFHACLLVNHKIRNIDSEVLVKVLKTHFKEVLSKDKVSMLDISTIGRTITSDLTKYFHLHFRKG